MDKLTLLPEWAPQSFIALAWPQPEGDFGPWLKEVEHTYSLISREISKRQQLLIIARDAAHIDHISALLARHPVNPARIHFTTLPYHDTWLRDTLPLTVWKRTRRQNSAGTQPSPNNLQFELVDFRFNGWGGKYPAETDDQLGERLYQSGLFGQVPYRKVAWVLEGGSLETDGSGTLLATRSSIQNPNRNIDPERAETVLRKTLGLERFLWLDHGHLEGDDTDGHIDTLVRFCAPDTIAYQTCTDISDPHYRPLRTMAHQLAGFRTTSGKPYRLLPLPMPKPIHGKDGRRLPASYANFLIINGAVLVPQYEDSSDSAAISILSQGFPWRRIIPIPARPLIHQYGSIHCLSMQFPLPLKLFTQTGTTQDQCA